MKKAMWTVATLLVVAACGGGDGSGGETDQSAVTEPTTPALQAASTTTTTVFLAAGEPEQTPKRWELDWKADMAFDDGSRIKTTYSGVFDITNATDPSGAGRELVGLFVGDFDGTVVVQGTSCEGSVDVSTGIEGNISGFWFPEDDSFEFVLDVTGVTDPKDIVVADGECAGVGFEGALALSVYEQIGSMPGSIALPREYRTALTPGPVSLRFTEANPNIHSTIDVRPAAG